MSRIYKLRQAYKCCSWSITERSFLGFCLFEFEGRKTHYDAKLTPRFARNLNVHLYGIFRLSFTTSSGYWSITRVAGFEPTHEGVKVPCLTAWLYPKKYGARWNRTTDTQGFNRLLYRTELSRLDIFAMTRARFELATHGASIHCSTC